MFTLLSMLDKLVANIFMKYLNMLFVSVYFQFISPSEITF